MISMEKSQQLEKDLFEEAERFWKNMLGVNAYLLNSKNFPLLANKRIMETLRNYEDKVAKEIARGVARVTYYFPDKDVVDRMVNTISKYEGEVAEAIAFRLANDDDNEDLKDKNVVVRKAYIFALDNAVNTIRKYTGEDAWEIVYELANAARKLEDNNKMRRLIDMLNVAGKSMFKLLSLNELYEILDLGLDKLVKDRESFDSVVAYIKSGKELPRPTEENINDYKSLALDYVKTRYNLAKDIDMEQLLMLFAIEEEDRKRAVELVNCSKEKNEKYYSLKIGEDSRLNYTPDELLRYAVLAVVGSRNKELEKEADEAIAKVVGKKAVNRARNSFRNHYKHLLKEIIPEVKENNWKGAWDRLKQTKEESILDVLNAANYRDVDIKRANFIRAVEDNNPLNYDSRVQMACVYLPSGIKKEDVLDYCGDERFMLVRYDIGNEPLGSAICFMEGENVLVDSVEGHRSFRKPEIHEIVYQDLVQRAKDKGAKRVIFNHRVGNETPREFIKYLGGKKLPEQTIEMDLNTDAYLEAGKEVEGYIMELGYGKI